MEDLNHRYRAHFQSVLWSALRERPGGVKDTIFQHLVTTGLQGGPSLLPGQTYQNMHMGARDVCGAPMSHTHAYACGRKEVGERHNNLARKFRDLAVLDGWRAHTEVGEQSVVIQHPSQEPSYKRAALHCVSADGEAWALDVRVVSGTGQIRNLLADAERAKNHECGCASGRLPHGVKFIPFVAHTCGRQRAGKE